MCSSSSINLLLIKKKKIEMSEEKKSYAIGVYPGKYTPLDILRNHPGNPMFASQEGESLTLNQK